MNKKENRGHPDSVKKYHVLMKAFRLLKENKHPIIASDVSMGNYFARAALETLCKLGIAERVPMIYKMGHKCLVSRDVKGYILKKNKKKEEVKKDGK